MESLPMSDVRSPTTEPGFESAAEILKALGQPLRLRLVCGLSQHPSTLSRIAAELESPISTVALHLGVLRRAGILAEERRGVEVVFSVRDARVQGILRTLCSSGLGPASSDWAWPQLARDLQTRRP
jgi:DNA-binding transcriptional ArsR family regulator